MANIGQLLQSLQGRQAVDPLSELLQSRGAAAAPFSSGLKPQALPNLVQQQAQAQDQSSDFYNQLQYIADNVNEQRQAAEDSIARNAQKAHDDALMRKIRAMIPQQISYGGGGGYSGGGGGGYSLPLVAPPSLSGGHKSGGSILPILPDITGGRSPKVAKPCTPHMDELGLC